MRRLVLRIRKYQSGFSNQCVVFRHETGHAVNSNVATPKHARRHLLGVVLAESRAQYYYWYELLDYSMKILILMYY